MLQWACVCLFVLMCHPLVSFPHHRPATSSECPPKAQLAWTSLQIIITHYFYILLLHVIVTYYCYILLLHIIVTYYYYVLLSHINIILLHISIILLHINIILLHIVVVHTIRISLIAHHSMFTPTARFQVTHLAWPSLHMNTTMTRLLCLQGPD